MNLNFKNTKKILFFLLLAALFFILIYNLLHYDPILGYDAEAHYSYIDTFSRYLPRSIYIPNAQESREFFSPPLTYIFPAGVQVICRNISTSQNLLEYCQPIYGKLTQIFQNLLFLASIYINLKTLQKFQNNKSLNLSFLILTMLVASNYRTVSMIRGELYILFFVSLLINYFLRMEIKNFEYSKKDIIIFGLIIGCLALSRQWVFLIFPAFFFLLLKTNHIRKKYFQFISMSFFVGFMISSWFYFINFFRYGTFTAFNTEANKMIDNSRFFEFISFNNVGEYIFSNPIRPYFGNKFFPIFYSEVWGDYWGYFTFTSRFLDIGRNQMAIGSYLGRVNLISLVTTIIIFFFFIKGVKNSKNILTINLINYSVILSFVGYFLFVVLYQTGSQGDTIKATYMTQFINLVVFVSAISIESIKNKKTYSFIILTLTVIFIHNFQSFLSHFPIFYP